MFIQEGLIWRRKTCNDYPERNVIVLPQSLKQDVIEAAHGNVLVGHGGITKTQERILKFRNQICEKTRKL